jgi:UDP-N-acetylglucosamine 4-epimerase
LNELAEFIIDCLKGLQIQSNFETKYCAFREGDIRHSLANIDKAKDCLGYKPEVDPKKGLMQAMQWYVSQNQK